MPPVPPPFWGCTPTTQRVASRLVRTTSQWYNPDMVQHTIREKLEQVPFTPFLIRASSGQAYRVADPSLVVLMKSRMFIAQPRTDRSATLPYLHIAGIEDPGNGNGRGASKRRRQ